MRPNPETIRLGEKEFVIKPLILRQVREIEALLTSKDWQEKPVAAGAMDILAVALIRDYASEAANLDEIEATPADLRRACSQILRLGGFVEDQAAGEAEAAGT